MSRQLLAERPSAALEYPLDELLVVHRLCCAGGIEVHACGIFDSELGGLLFVGHSGAGKSTTAQLWSTLRPAVVLSDDRVVLRAEAGSWRMYGTPWHGEARFSSARSTAIGRIFFLQHGPSNVISRLTSSRAAAELFARSFVPYYDSRSLAAALDCVHRLVEAVPCFQFSFVPDATAIAEIVNA